MAFEALIRSMTEAACRGDGLGVADCFTADGVYHDVFYGAFRGRDIARMIEGHFHRDARDFRWDLHGPVSDGAVGYARYVFSYESKLPGHAGQRACFEGVAICRLQDDLIADYREVA
ncbi:MAG: nuclear transport factor 2 family protein, partial [Pseudomonadota bacterium]